MADSNYTTLTAGGRDIQEVRLRDQLGQFVNSGSAPAVDSTGAALPAGYTDAAVNYTRNASGSIATEYRVVGGNTYTISYTRDANDNITYISQVVKS